LKKEDETYEDKMAEKVTLPDPSETVDAFFTFVLDVNRSGGYAPWVEKRFFDSYRPVQSAETGESSVANEM
jgi:hypothetical protein